MGFSRRTLLKATAASAVLGGVGAPYVARAQAAEWTYKFANNLPESHPFMVRAREMAAAIKAETNGRFDMQVFPNSQLGSDTDMLSQVRSGGVEFFTLSGLILATLVPAASINGIGFAFPDYPTVWKAMDGDLGAYVRGRAPGMSLDRMPLFVWSMLVTSFMVMFAMPSVMVASSCLIMDRLIGTHFFNPAEGGSVLLWQHLFWFFGHPEVYIIFIPALGIVSTIIADVLAAADLRLSGDGAVAGRDRASSASACGCTTCSRPACRSSARASSPPPA